MRINKITILVLIVAYCIGWLMGTIGNIGWTDRNFDSVMKWRNERRYIRKE